MIVSSAAGHRSFPQAAVYGATKFAQRGFLEALHHELVRHRRRCHRCLSGARSRRTSTITPASTVACRTGASPGSRRSCRRGNRRRGRARQTRRVRAPKHPVARHPARYLAAAGGSVPAPRRGPLGGTGSVADDGHDRGATGRHHQARGRRDRERRQHRADARRRSRRCDRAGGWARVQEESNRKAPIGLGEAVETTAGDMPSKWVIHAATMELGGPTSAEIIRKRDRQHAA